MKIATSLVWIAATGLVHAFVPVDPTQPITTSPRWSAGVHASTGTAGLHDGISVAVAPDTAETLLTAVLGTYTPEDVADTEDAIVAAFAGWENPVLAFRVTFDGPAVRGDTAGAEIDLFAVPGSDPAFVPIPTAFGVTYLAWLSEPSRLLTNGTTLGGLTIHGADIFLNLDNLLAISPVFPDHADKKRALQRLLMHEIGHAIGLHHPNEFTGVNLDTDADPLNVMPIDPANPFAALIPSSNIDRDPIMTNRPMTIPGALLFTELRNDDRGGRDVLYPALPTVICPPVPHSHCRRAPSSVLTLKLPADPRKRKLVWKWNKGPETALADFGDPLTARTHGVCIYDGTPARLLESLVPASGIRWQAKGSKGFDYKDRDALQGGIKKLELKAGVAGKAKVGVIGKGAALPSPALGGVATPITVQLVNQESPVCFEAVYGASDLKANDAGQLKAKVKP